MKKYFIYAASALALASCSSNDFVGDNGGNVQGTDNGAINFGGETGKMTRVSSNATQTYSLQQLKENGFWVYGIKYGDAEQPASGDKDNVVYKNYRLEYNEGTANNTVSNTSGWEYVGVKNSPYRDNVTPEVTEDQTIKYWDYSAAGYTFYAATADPTDVKKGNVVFKKIESAEDGGTVYDKGYKVKLKTGANIDQLYFADRKPITKPTSYADENAPTHGNDNQYGGEVNFMFRSGLSKVRVGMYETVPGYSVEIDKFYYTGAGATDATTEGKDGFYADVTNTPLQTSENGVEYTVTYYDDTDPKIENRPKINPNESGEGSTQNFIKLVDNGDNSLKANVTLSEDVLNPTYDQCTVTNKTTSGKYTWFLPQTDNTRNLKLKVDYTLTSLDGSKEKIHVKGATATIPAAYLKWKPNYAYTYLFKISTNTNGITGNNDDPAGLYPITFDANVTLTDDGNAEYITALGEASITTFAYNNNKYETGGSDYTAGNDIYVTVTDQNGSVVSEIGENTKFYKITDAGVKAGANEAQVAEWIENNKTDYYNSLTNSEGNTYYKFVTSVPSEDSKLGDISINAYKLSNLEAGTYAVEYELPNAWTGEYKKIYKVITVMAKSN